MIVTEWADVEKFFNLNFSRQASFKTKRKSLRVGFVIVAVVCDDVDLTLPVRESDFELRIFKSFSAYRFWSLSFEARHHLKLSRAGKVKSFLEVGTDGIPDISGGVFH